MLSAIGRQWLIQAFMSDLMKHFCGLHQVCRSASQVSTCPDFLFEFSQAYFRSALRFPGEYHPKARSNGSRCNSNLASSTCRKARMSLDTQKRDGSDPMWGSFWLDLLPKTEKKARTYAFQYWSVMSLPSCNRENHRQIWCHSRFAGQENRSLQARGLSWVESGCSRYVTC